MVNEWCLPCCDPLRLTGRHRCPVGLAAGRAQHFEAAARLQAAVEAGAAGQYGVQEGQLRLAAAAAAAASALLSKEELSSADSARLSACRVCPSLMREGLML